MWCLDFSCLGRSRLNLPSDPISGVVLKEMCSKTSALARMCSKGPVTVAGVERLLAARACPDALCYGARETSYTPLTDAADSGHTEVVKCLVGAGADVDLHTTCIGRMPLHCACKPGHLDIVRFLCESKANIDKAHRDGSTPLLEAVKNGRKSNLSETGYCGKRRIQNKKKHLL